MKILKSLIIPVLYILSVQGGIAQCKIDAGSDISITCGESVKLPFIGMFNQKYPGNVQCIKGFSFINQDTGYCSWGYNSYGNRGSIERLIKTTDGGKSWTQDTMYLMGNTFLFLTSKLGFTSAYNGRIYKTVDGGLSWSYKEYNYYDGFYVLNFTSRDTGFAAGDNALIMKTSDQGDSWNIVNFDTTKVIQSMFFVNSEIGYAAGFDPYQSLCYLMKTVNGGDQWTRIADTMHYELMATYFTSVDTGFVTGLERFPYFWGETSDILKTVDGGLSWRVVQKVPGVTLNTITFLDSRNGFAAGTKGTLLRTSDGGETWSSFDTKLTDEFIAMASADKKSLVLGGSNNMGIYRLDMPSSIIWEFPDGGTDSLEATPVVTPLNSGTYKVHARFGSSCTATDTVTINVAPFEISASDIDAPCGSNATLGVTTNYGGTGNLQYSWSPAELLSDPHSSNPVATVDHSTDFSVDVNSPEGCSAHGVVKVIKTGLDVQPAICLVTVGDKSKNQIIWQKPVSENIDSFFIYRESTSQSEVWDLIGKVPYMETNLFTDSGSNARIQSNRYKVAIKDRCMNVSPLSAAHKTMHLNINQGQGSAWNLIWEGYEGFQVSSYKIYRGTTLDNLQLIGSTAGGSSSYTDFAAPTGNVYYQIEVISPNSCSVSKSGTFTSAKSNIASNTADGINTNNEATDIVRVYPVPAFDHLFVEGRFSERSRYTIWSADGKQVSIGTMNPEGSIDVSALSKGLYLLKITDLKGTRQARFVKE